MPLDPQIGALLQMLEAAGTPAISAGTPEAARAALRTLLVDLRNPASVIEVADVRDETVAGRPARVYRPETAEGTTIVFLHGGGFVIGDLDTHDNVCRRLARDTGAVVVSIDYPLAPEEIYPAAPEHCYAALREVVDRVGEFGGDAARIVIGGDSAGGNLAAVCAQRAHRDGLGLAAQLLVYPAVDMFGDYASRTENATGYFLTLDDMLWFAANYTGVTGEDDPAADALRTDVRLSPLLADDLSGLAPAIVATAEFDPLRDEGNAYATALERAGVRVEHRQFAGLIHGFYGMESFSTGADAATTWINAELREVIGGTATP